MGSKKKTQFSSTLPLLCFLHFLFVFISQSLNYTQPLRYSPPGIREQLTLTLVKIKSPVLGVVKKVVFRWGFGTLEVFTTKKDNFGSNSDLIGSF